jgi:Flp pilus assembly protein TadD
VDLRGPVAGPVRRIFDRDESIFKAAMSLTVDPTFQTALQHHQAGRLSQARDLYQQILAQQPDHAGALHLSGVIALQEGRNDLAVDLIGKAIALGPSSPEAHCNLGIALQEKGQLTGAVAAYRRAIALKPNYPAAHSNLGAALRDTDKLDEAIAAFRQAIALGPSFADAHSNLGIALRDKGQLDDAITAYRQALALKPDYPEAHHNLALLLLLRGDFLAGWNEFEWRWRCKQFPSPCRTFDQPQWDGSDLAGRTILLHAEQGFGDTIQLIRYVPLVASRRGKVILQCGPELQRLLGRTTGIARWVGPGGDLPPFDIHCPLLSLPRAFGTTLQSIPQAVPYLQADAEGVERWRRELAADGGRFRVGLAWAGRPTHRNDRNRSLSLSTLAPLAQARGMTFYSLQKGEAGKQAANPPAGLELVDWTAELNDFADTAALIANLDLVISVDTAVVHLAGAMAKPAWTLLPFVPDWRWLLEREDSPWYPTMRLFRQPSRGDWGSVIARVAEALALSDPSILD